MTREASESLPREHVEEAENAFREKKKGKREREIVTSLSGSTNPPARRRGTNARELLTACTTEPGYLYQGERERERERESGDRMEIDGLAHQKWKTTVLASRAADQRRANEERTANSRCENFRETRRNSARHASPTPRQLPEIFNRCRC